MARLIRSAAAAVLALCLLSGAGAAAPPDAASGDAARRGAAYLASIQRDDGSWMSPGATKPWRSDQVAEAVLSMHAGGGQHVAVERGLAWIRDHGDADANRGPFAGRIVTALVAVGADPRAFGGVNYVARIKSFHNPATGDYGGDNLYGDVLAMLGLLAAGEELPDQALNRVLLTQCDDGGWSHTLLCSQTRDVDTTAVAAAVVAATRGPDSATARRARTWLANARKADAGCWGYAPNATPNANSCALVVNTILSLGEDPAAAPWTAGNRDPLAALRDLQLPSGGFRYLATQNEPNSYATVQAVFALAGGSFPTSPPAPPPGSGGDDDDDDPPPLTGTTRRGGGGAPTGPDDGNGGGGGGDPRVRAPGRPGGVVDDPDDDGGGTQVAGRTVRSGTGSGDDEGDGRRRPGGFIDQAFGGSSGLGPAGGSGSVSVTDDGDGGGMGLAPTLAAGLLASVGGAVGWWGRRRSALPLLGVAALLALPLAAVAGTPEACLAAPGEIAVRVVVDTGTLDDAPTERVTTTCVTVPQGATGADVLAARAERLGTPEPRYDASGLLCAIDGYPESGCGDQTPTGYRYWGYYEGTARGWEYAEVGPAARKVTAQASEGWRFNDGSGPENPPPRRRPDPGCTPAAEAAAPRREEEDGGGFPVGALAGVAGVAAMGTAAVVVSRRRASP